MTVKLRRKNPRYPDLTLIAIRPAAFALRLIFPYYLTYSKRRSADHGNSNP